MMNQLPKDIVCKKIAWTITDFSKLNTKKLYSEVFTVSGSEWRILIFPKGNNVADSLSVYLEVADAASLPEGWSIYAEFSMAVVNQVSRERSVEKDLEHQFHENAHDGGLRSFMPLSTLHDPDNGYIVNDTCIIEVEWFVMRSKQIGTKPISHPNCPSLSKESKEEPTNSNVELVNFKDLGKIEKNFVPLLEEVCLWHPSLVECQKKRTRRFIEWAFTALGRVLHFLKTKKGKDMIEPEDACEQLQHLWEELETFRFDLTWLEPYVQSALGMKAYKEKAEQVKMLKENLFSLETEMKKLREKLADTEENIEKVRKDLEKAEGGFEEKDMDAELGYGNGKL